MARTRGARNAGFEDRRASLLARLRERLGREGATHASWRELAAAAGVGLSTMSHYFGRREDVVRAIMEDDLRLGEVYLATMRIPAADFPASVRGAVADLVAGFADGGVSEMFASGLIQGLRHPSLGPAFLANVLEPTLTAVEDRLKHHMRAGEMIEIDARHAALALVAPLLVAALHQNELGGATHRPMAMTVMADDHAAAFIRAFGVRG